MQITASGHINVKSLAAKRVSRPGRGWTNSSSITDNGTALTNAPKLAVLVGYLMVLGLKTNWIHTWMKLTADMNNAPQFPAFMNIQALAMCKVQGMETHN
jgi:hypothetical protein